MRMGVSRLRRALLELPELRVPALSDQLDRVATETVLGRGLAQCCARFRRSVPVIRSTSTRGLWPQVGEFTRKGDVGGVSGFRTYRVEVINSVWLGK